VSEDCLVEHHELIGGTTEFVRNSNLDLASLGGPGSELSTGLILTWRDKLVFGVEPRAIPLGAMGQPGITAFVGIGGHLDPGERWGDAVVREALEEANCSVSLVDSPVTYLCLQDQTPSPIAHAWASPAPAGRATRPERPDQQRRHYLVNAVFRRGARSTGARRDPGAALLTRPPAARIPTTTLGRVTRPGRTTTRQPNAIRHATSSGRQRLFLRSMVVLARRAAIRFRR
jgi:8-oxo-dGTP pyrophosphatase MutT (NUDIX family)